MELQLLQSARLVSLGQMAAGVAHELNQPLGALSATAEDYFLRLQEGLEVTGEQWEEMLRRMVAMTERMTGTVEHLRVLSRDTSEEPNVSFSVNDVIRSSMGLMGTQLGNHGITVDLDLHDGLPAVSGHSQRLEQVIINLVGNARDALDEREEHEGEGGREKRLTVRAWGEGDERSHVVVEVEDNGIGISEGDTNRIFDPFYTTKGPDRGTGLGLSISHAIVRNHGGQIGCESTKGEGTVFRIWLPAEE